MSKMKTKLDQKTLEKMVKKGFGSEVELNFFQELTEGFCNMAYELILSNGINTVLKVAVADDKKKSLMSCEVEMMQTEVAAMKLLAEKPLVKCAEVYYHDTSREECSSEYFFMEKLEGSSLFSQREIISQEQRADIMLQMGQLLKSLHTYKGKKFGHFFSVERQFDTWYEAFYFMVEGVVRDAKNVSVHIGPSYEMILSKLKEQKDYFIEVTEASFVHWDTWDGNIFVKNGKISGLIDWERSLWGDGLIEDRFRFHSQTQELLDGYGLKELTKAQEVRCKWYDVYLYIIMMSEGKYREYETDDQYNWVYGMFLPIWEEIKQF